MLEIFYSNVFTQLFKELFPQVFCAVILAFDLGFFMKRYFENQEYDEYHAEQQVVLYGLMFMEYCLISLTGFFYGSVPLTLSLPTLIGIKIIRKIKEKEWAYTELSTSEKVLLAVGFVFSVVISILFFHVEFLGFGLVTIPFIGSILNIIIIKATNTICSKVIEYFFINKQTDVDILCENIAEDLLYLAKGKLYKGIIKLNN